MATALTATGLLAALGARLPVIAAPMAGGPSTPALVIAAAGAGALGFLAAGYKSAGELRAQIAAVRERTDCFGVNLFAPNPVRIGDADFTAYRTALLPLARRYGIDLPERHTGEGDDDDWDAKIDLLIREPVPVVSFTFGLPTPVVIARLRAVGTRTVQSVTAPDEALLAARRGVDGLVVQSSAAGGHCATLTPERPVPELPLEQLLREVAGVVRLPLWAAGGIATAAQVRSVVAAGAEAAAVGTVLLRSPESGASATYKRGLVELAEAGTRSTTAFTGRPARALRNAFVEAFTDLAPLGYPALHVLTGPIRRAATLAGDIDGINVWAGTGHREARDLPAAEVLRRLAGA